MEKRINLLQACAQGNLKEIKRICSSSKRQGEIDLRDNHNWRPLHHAVRFANVNCLQELLQHPQIDTRAETFEGLTALHIACKMTYIPIEIIQLLLDKDIELVEWVTNEEVSPLQISIETKRLDIVRLLVEKANADVNFCDLDGENALFYAVRAEQLDIVQYLLYGTNCKVHQKNDSQINVLDLCMYQKQKSMEHPVGVNHKCALEILNFFGSEMPISTIESTLDSCFKFFDIQILAAIINQFYLDTTKNARCVSIIQQILKSKNSLEIIWKYYLVLPLHHSIRHDDESFWILFRSLQNVNSVGALRKLHKADQSLFCVYLPFLLSEIGMSFSCNMASWANDLVSSLVKYTDWKPLTDLTISFCKELAVYGFNLNFAFESLKECMARDRDADVEEVFRLLIRWSTSRHPYYPSQIRNNTLYDQMIDSNFIEIGDIFRDYYRYKAFYSYKHILCSATVKVPKLFYLCRIRVREVVFKANVKLSNYNQILRLNELPVPTLIKNKLRYIV